MFVANGMGLVEIMERCIGINFRQQFLQPAIVFITPAWTHEHGQYLRLAPEICLIVSGVIAECGRVIDVLWHLVLFVCRPHHNRNSGRIQMKSGVDESIACHNRANIAQLQQFSLLHLYAAKMKMRWDPFLEIEAPCNMNAGAMHHMKGAGKCVLMNSWRCTSPEENLNTEVTAFIHGERRLAKRGPYIYLIRQSLSRKRVLDHLFKRGMLARRHLCECCRCDLRKPALIEIEFFPELISVRTKFLKVFHSNTYPSLPAARCCEISS